jgi:hypothetical protein
LLEGWLTLQDAAAACCPCKAFCFLAVIVILEWCQGIVAAAVPLVPIATRVEASAWEPANLALPAVIC